MVPAIPAEMNVASWVLDTAAQQYGFKTAIIGDAAAVLYSDLCEQVNRAGWGFRSIGCKAGDLVLICLPDSAEFIVALLGLLKIGAVPVPVSPFVSSADYLYYLSGTMARFIVMQSSLAPQIPTGNWTRIVVGADSDGSRVGWEHLLSASSGKPLDAYLTTADTLAMLLYTSGSTNKQKCVMHSHRSIAMACQNIANTVFGITPDDRVLSIPKPFFAFGFGGGVLFPLYMGATTIVTSKRTDLKEAIEYIRSYRPTILCAIPTFLSLLLQARSSLDVDLSSIRLIVSAGESLGGRLFEAYRSAFSIEVLDGIGSTEMLTHFISNRPGESYAGSCGVEVPDCKVSLVNDDGEPVQVGEVGRLFVQAPTAFLGYWQDEAATARARVGDWVVTGDNMYRDEDGRYYFCGRSDDMLKVGGVWVFPHEVESALRQHEDVAQAVVTTCEDGTGRRRLVAYLVPKAAAELRITDILRFVSSKIPAYMIPSAFVPVSQLPLTVNGKLNRRALPTPHWPSAHSLSDGSCLTS